MDGAYVGEYRMVIAIVASWIGALDVEHVVEDAAYLELSKRPAAYELAFYLNSLFI